MALNFIKRKITVPNADYFYETVENFYIIWTRDNQEFYFCDYSMDATQMLWSSNRLKAVKFEDGKDALEILKEIKLTRHGPGIIELKIINEQILDPTGWMI